MSLRIALPLTTICILIALLGGCSTVDTKSSAIPGADLSGYSTYHWEPLTVTTSETRIDPSSPTHKELVRLMDREFRAAGLSPVPAGQGELAVKYAVARVDDYSTTVVTDERPYDRYTTSIRPEARVTGFETGSLLVDVRDAENLKLLWRGTAKTHLQEDSGPVRDKALLAKVVSGMFEDFPR